MKILFAFYRDWARNVFDGLDMFLYSRNCTYEHVCNPEQLEERATSQEWDAIVLIGWSWKVPARIVGKSLVVGMHPSDLPDYAGGSPIQNQILDGIETTKATLFRLNEKFDDGEIIDKEPIDLRGHLSDVFASIGQATINLIMRFVDKFPDIEYVKQEGTRRVVKRLKPEQSRLNNPTGVTCKEMWDMMRCREDPYPNVYFEDDTGRLVVKHVEFISK